MELNNNTLIIRGPSRQITRGSGTRTITDDHWDTYIAPVLYPLWSSDRDKLQYFEYSNGASETWKCDKSIYVRNHTTGQYYWKDYLFTEPPIDNVREFVQKVREAYDAVISIDQSTVDEKFKRILEKETGITLTRVKAWRNFFLHTSDWTMLEDAPVTAEEKQQWKDWRVKIRALPDVFTDPGVNVVTTVKVPIDPKVYKEHFLPYNEGVAYLSTDEQYVSFPPHGTGAGMEEAMQRFVMLAIQFHRPAPLFNGPNISHITDPVEALVARIEQEQKLLDEFKAQSS
tara:strand:+ start:17321 stop:18178 length:858 start_codon:yes stop_codon:yes gene_type:complete